MKIAAELSWNMSGHRVKLPDLCQCRGCTRWRNRLETPSDLNRQPRRGTQRPRPLVQPSAQPTQPNANVLSSSVRTGSSERKNGKNRKKSENPGVVAKVSLRWEGWKVLNDLDNIHWKLVVTILSLLVVVLLFPGARGEVVKVGEGHEIELTRSQSAFLIDSRAHQINLCSTVEYFSKKPLTQLQEKIDKWRKVAKEWDELKEVTLDKVENLCPVMGEGGSAENPTLGPFPKLLSYVPRGSPYLAIASRQEDTVRCSYFFKKDFIANRNRVGDKKDDLKKLFPRSCFTKVKKGMIIPKKNYVTHIFETKQPTNILACAELCINQYERAVVNATCSGADQMYTECPSEMPKCHYWSFNAVTNFCLLYLNKQIWAQQKTSSYDKLNEKSGFAADSWTGPVHCGDLKQKEKIWIRSGSDKNRWIPLKGACAFQERPKESTKVYGRCKEASSLMQMLIQGMDDKISRFSKLYKLTAHPQSEGKTKRSQLAIGKEKRSQLAIPHHLISPAVQKFLISAMSSVLPNMAGFSSIVLGPLIGTFLYLTSALMAFVVQLALENQQKVLNKGIVELQRLEWGNLNKKWDIWKSSNLLKVSGYENQNFYDTNYPLSGLNNVSRELKLTLDSFGDILEKGEPILPKIIKEMENIPFTFLALDAGEYIKKVYFFTKTNKKVPKLQISVFLSLDQTAPFLEGVVSGDKQTDAPTIQCADIFRRSLETPAPCFDRNALGSTTQAKFLIGKQLYVFKVLGQKVVQIKCPETSLTTFSSGIMIFLASSSCKIHISGNLFFNGEKSKLGSFKILLESRMNNTDALMPLPQRLQTRLDKLQGHWNLNVIGLLASNSGCWIVIIAGMLYKLYLARFKRNQNVVRYNPPVLLPMKNLKPSRFQINDKKETRSNK